MGNLIVGAAGAAIGGTIGGPFGAQVGWALGSTLGGMLFSGGSESQEVSQPLIDLRVPGTEYGQAIPWLRGAMAMSGQYWWNSDKIPHYQTETQGGGGGKGGQPEQTTTTITYTVDVLLGFTCNGGVGVGRIWEDGTLIRRGAAATSIDSEHWERLTVYTGGPSQLPDPDYEAAVGAGNAPAYRGRFSIFIKGLNLGQSGALRNLVFEIIKDGSYGGIITEYFGGSEAEANEGNLTGSFHEPLSNTIWVSDSESPNIYGQDGQVLVFDLVSRTWLAPVPLNATYSIYSGATSGFRLVEEWDRAYVGAADSSSGAETSLIYEASTRTYLDNTDELLGTGFFRGRYVVGADPDNNQLLLIEGNDWVLRDVVDGIPLDPEVAITADPDKAFDPIPNVYHDNPITPGLLDEDGQYWFAMSGGLNFARVYQSGAALITARHSIGADSIATDCQNSFAYDPVRNCIYYLSSNYQYLMKWDCSTRTASRLNATAYSSTPSSDYFFGSLANAPKNTTIHYSSTLDQILLLHGGAAGAGSHLHLVDPDTGESAEIIQIDHGVGGTNHFTGQIAYVESEGCLYSYSARGEGTMPGGIGELCIGSTPSCPTVQDVQESICLRAGLQASQFDVSALSSITRRVCSLPWTDVSPAAGMTDALMSCFFYEATVSDKIYFVPRGGAPVATIEYDEMGAGELTATGDGLTLREVSDLELPARLALSYINVSNDYQNDSQTADRLVSYTSVTAQSAAVPIGMTPSNAKISVDAMLADQAASVWVATFATLGDRCFISPCDVVLVEGHDGSIYRLRVVKVDDSFPLLTWEAVLDQASVLDQQGITSTDYESSTEVVSPVRTDMELLDIATLRDADDDRGYYLVMKGWGSPYPGGSAYVSADDVTYSFLATIYEPGVFGRCTTVLGDWDGPRIIDEVNSVTVNVWPGTLSSSTRDNVLNDQSVNAVLVGDEMLQFITATLVSEGVYRLSRLLRGSRGTEWAMSGHGAAERCVLLRAMGMRRVIPEASAIGLSRYYKSVTLGRASSTATPQTFTPAANGLKPFSLFDLRASRDDYDNMVITFQRRSRLSTRAIGAAGILIPLAESAESYELDVYEDTSDGGTLVRTLTGSTTTITYTAAEWAADGFAIGDPVRIKAFQLSAEVGRGYELDTVVIL